MATANPPAMDLDLPVDPNEPTYCLCNQVSYGEMVACDNPDVSIVVKVTKWAGLVTVQNRSCLVRNETVCVKQLYNYKT